MCQIKAIYFTLTARNLSQIFNSISETSNKSSDLIKAGLTRNNTTSLAKMKIPFSLIPTINLRQYLVTTIIAPCLRDSHPFGHDPTEPISQKPTTCSAINLPTLESRTFKFSNLECYILIMAHARKLIAISSLTILLNRASNSLSSRMKLLKKNTSDEIEGLIDYNESNLAVSAYKKTARKANSDLTFAKFKNDRTGFIHPKLASIVELSALLDFVPQNLFMEDPST